MYVFFLSARHDSVFSSTLALAIQIPGARLLHNSSHPSVFWLPRDATMIPSIDHSNGRAVLLNGNIFYSPNCARDVTLPETPVHMRLENVFADDRDPRLRHFQQPSWWTSPFGFLGFLPLQPSFQGYPFDRLAHIPTLERSRDGYHLHPALSQSWYRLEQMLAFATLVLSKRYNLVVLRPFYPWAWGYRCPHKDGGIARQRVVLSRDWFVIWIGMLSYLIAMGECQTAAHDGDIPDWFTTLVEVKCEQIWVAGIATSIAATFSQAVPRVGLFVHALEAKAEKNQPPVTWLCRKHIPVWYPWGAEEVQALQKGNTALADLAPPTHKLQEVTTFHTRELAPPDAPHEPIPTVPRDNKIIRQKWQQYFVEYFELRAQDNARRIGKETAREQQARLNRERKPPTVSAQVFEWALPDNYGSHYQPSELVRKAVVKKMREDTLGYYTANQRRYDPVRNEWDCCELFGSGADDWDDWESEQPEETIHLDSHVSDIHNLDMENRQRSPSPPPTAVESPIIDAPDTYEVIDILVMHYGFVPPLPLPEYATPVDLAARPPFLRLLGLQRQDDLVFASPLGRIAYDFVHALASHKKPDPSLWDLARGNRKSLAFSHRLACIQPLPSGLFVFDFGPESTVPWKIAVTNAADALFVCRLESSLQDLEIARALLQRGIPFRTLLPLAPVPPSPLPPPALVPIRLSGYSFTKRDYDAYLHQRVTILNSPGGRAALLRGGILWRIAVQETSFDDVLRGPSMSTLVHRRGFSVEDGEGNTWWDDELEGHDAALLCGGYNCYTGKVLVQSKVSI
jgi:hypothetical protein